MDEYLCCEHCSKKCNSPDCHTVACYLPHHTTTVEYDQRPISEIAASITAKVRRELNQVVSIEPGGHSTCTVVCWYLYYGQPVFTYNCSCGDAGFHVIPREK